MNRFLRAALLGAVAGTKATFPMTAWMGTAKALGLLGEAPPKKITRAALRAVGLAGETNEAERNAATAAMHFAFGGGMGALFGVLREAKLWPKGILGGAAFGTAVWAISYMGWVPALAIMPKPSADRPMRPTMMIAAHWVYGISLARGFNP